MLCDSLFRKVDLSGVKITDCNREGMTIDGVRVADLLAAYRAGKKECYVANHYLAFIARILNVSRICN